MLLQPLATAIVEYFMIMRMAKPSRPWLHLYPALLLPCGTPGFIAQPLYNPEHLHTSLRWQAGDKLFECRAANQEVYTLVANWPL
jgi:hypothetical protein